MKTSFALLLLCSWLMAGCSAPRPLPETPAGRLWALFPAERSRADTLHFFLPETAAGPIAPAELLEASLGQSQLEALQFGTGAPQFRVLWKYAFTPQLDACLLQTEEFWFGKQSLLLFDKRQKRFIQTLEVANFYGGDGGQTATESWWFRKTGAPLFYVKTADHGFSLHEASEPTEYLSESGVLLQWESSVFKPVINPDSSLFLQKFKMARQW